MALNIKPIIYGQKCLFKKVLNASNLRYNSVVLWALALWQ